MYCKPTGLDAGIPVNGFAQVSLMANDHLHHGVMPTGQIEVSSSEDFAALVTELLAMQEFSGHLRPHTVTRAYSMFVACPKRLLNHPDYIDIEQALVEATGLTYSKLLGITVGFISRYFTLKLEELRTNPRLAANIPDYLAKLKIPTSDLFRYFELTSGSPLALQQELQQTAVAPNDVTIFRKFPLVDRWFDIGTVQQRLGHVPLDIELWWQKVYAGPFWFLFAKFRTKFTTFWGAVFEEYAHSLLEPRKVAPRYALIRNPKSPRNPNEELCDAVVVEGDSIVIIEYKATLIRADIKYSGDVNRLSLHLQNKFVRDGVSGKPKAIAQLANAAKCLFKGDRPSVPWADLSLIRKCYLFIITLDDIGETFAMSPFLETFMKENLDKAECADVSIRPVFCTSIGTIERIASALANGSMVSILERWYAENPVLSMPLISIRMEDLAVPRTDDEWNRWVEAIDVAKHELFDDETIAAGTP
jgi:hypothetical protein